MCLYNLFPCHINYFGITGLKVNERIMNSEKKFIYREH